MSKLAKTLIAGTALITLTASPAFALGTGKTGLADPDGASAYAGVHFMFSGESGGGTGYSDDDKKDKKDKDDDDDDNGDDNGDDDDDDNGGGGDDGDDEAPGFSEIINGQVNLRTVWSTLDVIVSDVEGDVSAASVAVGNSLSVSTMNDTSVENYQSNMGNIGAELWADVSNVGGNVDLTAAAICNSADIFTDPQFTGVVNNQNCGARDPAAILNGTIDGVGGDVSLAAAAIGNSLSVESNAANMSVESWQQNSSGTFATVNAEVSNVAGNVSATAAAIGNSVTVTHY